MRIDYDKYIKERIESNNKKKLNNKDINIFFGNYNHIMNYDIICQLLSLDKFIHKNILVLSLPPRKILRRIFPIAYNNMLAIPPYILAAKIKLDNIHKRKTQKKFDELEIINNDLLKMNNKVNKNIQKNNKKENYKDKEKLNMAIFTVGYITSLASSLNPYIFKQADIDLSKMKLNNILILSEEEINEFGARMILIGYLSSLGFHCIELGNIVNNDIINQYINNKLNEEFFNENILSNIYNISNKYSKKCCKLIYEQFHKLIPMTFLNNEFFHDKEKKLTNKQLIKAILEESGINYFIEQYKEELTLINTNNIPGLNKNDLYKENTTKDNSNDNDLYENNLYENDNNIKENNEEKYALEMHQHLLFLRQSYTAKYMHKLLNSIEKDY